MPVLDRKGYLTEVASNEKKPERSGQLPLAYFSLSFPEFMTFVNNVIGRGDAFLDLGKTKVPLSNDNTMFENGILKFRPCASPEIRTHYLQFFENNDMEDNKTIPIYVLIYKVRGWRTACWKKHIFHDNGENLWEMWKNILFREIDLACDVNDGNRALSLINVFKMCKDKKRWGNDVFVEIKASLKKRRYKRVLFLCEILKKSTKQEEMNKFIDAYQQDALFYASNYLYDSTRKGDLLVYT